MFGLNCSGLLKAGHSSGTQLALMLALYPIWRAAEGKRPEALAGVLSILGIVDLQPESAASPEEEALDAAAFPGDDDRRAVSPIRFDPGVGEGLYDLVVSEKKRREV
jgi:hypothetical protein